MIAIFTAYISYSSSLNPYMRFISSLLFLSYELGNL